MPTSTSISRSNDLVSTSDPRLCTPQRSILDVDKVSKNLFFVLNWKNHVAEQFAKLLKRRRSAHGVETDDREPCDLAVLRGEDEP